MAGAAAGAGPFSLARAKHAVLHAARRTQLARRVPALGQHRRRMRRPCRRAAPCRAAGAASGGSRCRRSDAPGSGWPGPLFSFRSSIATAWFSRQRRFVGLAAVVGHQSWLGILMPGHGRAGGRFPLLLACAVEGTPSLAERRPGTRGGSSGSKSLHLPTPDDDFALDVFDAALTVLAAAPPAAPRAGARAAPAGAVGKIEVVVLGAGEVSALSPAGLAVDQSVWWAVFAALLDLRPARREWGWTQGPESIPGWAARASTSHAAPSFQET
jgi:hypothetical protein